MKDSVFVAVMTDDRDRAIIVMHGRRCPGEIMGKAAALDLAQKLRENAEKLP